MGDTSPTALVFVVIGAVMGFGREPLTRFYSWIYFLRRKQAPHPKLVNVTRLYLIFMSFIFTVAGILGLLKIVKM